MKQIKCIVGLLNSVWVLVSSVLSHVSSVWAFLTMPGGPFQLCLSEQRVYTDIQSKPRTPGNEDKNALFPSLVRTPPTQFCQSAQKVVFHKCDMDWHLVELRKNCAHWSYAHWVVRVPEELSYIDDQVPNRLPNLLKIFSVKTIFICLIALKGLMLLYLVYRNRLNNWLRCIWYN